MQDIDFSKQVMDKVVRLEKRRVGLWLTWFGVMMGILTIVALIAFVVAVKNIQERGTLDLLTLFTDDREVIAEFWQDTLVVFWEELPQGKLVLGGLALAIVVGTFLATRGSRKIITRKFRQLRQYPQPFSDN